MRRLKVGVIGVGHLGKSHARIFAGLRDVELAGVVDINPLRAAEIANQHGAAVFADHLAMADHVDAASIVTPTIHHHEIACEYLRRGIPILVEKPLAVNLEQANELVELSQRTGTMLQVGHIERFNPVYEELRRLPINPKFVECERHGAFTGRSIDIGAVLDLMIHDLDLLLDLVGGQVAHVEAVGAAIFGGHEDIVNARVKFASGCIVNLTASRMSPTPKRKMRIWAPEGYAGVDFVKRRLTLVQPSHELRTNGIPADPAFLPMFKEQVFARFLRMREVDLNHGDNLTRELEHFVQCVRTGSAPRVRGQEGRDAIALATRIIDSLNRHSWENRPNGPIGPDQLPNPLGDLVPESIRRVA